MIFDPLAWPISRAICSIGTPPSDNSETTAFIAVPTSVANTRSWSTGAATALHSSPRAVPADVTEVLLVARLPADRTRPGTAQFTDLDTGRPLGRLELPSTGHTGLLQLGALQREDDRWYLQVAPAALGHDLGALPTAAAVRVG